MRALTLAAALLTLAIAAPGFSQTLPPVARAVSLSGPRVGATFLSQGVVDKLSERNIYTGSVISQFGWQIEKQFFSTSSDITAVTELVGLLGGLEESLAIPSLTWLVGVRTRHGTEFGVGPNVTPAGAALAIAGGVTFRYGVLNVPINVAYVPAKAGPRVTILSGFSLRGRR